ncbi:hypothetical protein PRN20_02535 [Devosia sp. ZB163]|uniref:hypothetical protein n=1 Tax=Devosia sp. ZB163 TaxID=3025938 RepID=UPI00235F45D7|nr:hypothetical protein [Devosia sp. ZB163]MDC9822599.1 hypothetical protein [Devosia sp. ZB163]
MSHDSTDGLGSSPSDGDIGQAIFLGWLAAGLLGFIAVFTVAVLVIAAMHGFS